MIQFYSLNKNLKKALYYFDKSNKDTSILYCVIIDAIGFNGNY